MNMPVRMGTAHDRAIDFCGVELKHLSLAVIDADERMIVTHRLTPKARARGRR
jgi:hypothetical protein